MKIRPVTSSLNRRRSLDGTTPTSIAKHDFKLLLSSAETINKVDDKLYKLTETAPIEPMQILSSEISRQLTNLKNSNNSTHISKHHMNFHLRHLSVELSEVSKASKLGKQSLSIIAKRTEKLEKQIKSIQELQIEALSDQEVYFHIQERMLSSQIFLDVKKHALNGQIKQKSLILEETQRVRAQTTEKQTKNLRQFKDLNKSFNFFNIRTETISRKIHKDQELMEIIDMDREQRYFKQQDIIEKVGISEQDLKEKDIRESLMLHKLWYKRLSKQLKVYTDKFSKIDQAFKRIKCETSVDNVLTVVEKFLTREEHLVELTNIIRKSKIQLEEFDQRNSSIQDRIKAIEVYDKSSITASMIKQLSSQILFLSGRNSTSHSKYLEIFSLIKTVREWISRMIRFFDPEFEIKEENLGELVKVLREKIQLNIRPISKFSTQDSSFFVTNFNAGLGKSRKIFVDDVVELAELNYLDSDRSSWHSGDKRLKRK